jgi:phosphatidylserine/phosphatidylglycerophosphate/cardiolipin synthase-like enzyme
VNIDDAIELTLERLSNSQVEALAQACTSRQAPDTTLGQVVIGAQPGAGDAIAQLADAWTATVALTGAGVAVALRIGLLARRRADARRSRAVWTGPGSNGAQRLTATVLRDLLTSARERILMVSFAAYTLSDLATDLEDAVERGCEIDVVFETADDSGGGYADTHSTPFGAVHGISRWRWPTDQRTAGGLLHAKVLVVDGSRALVGSANLTYRALHANLEAGILVEDSELAASIERHIRMLMNQGILLQSIS